MKPYWLYVAVSLITCWVGCIRDQEVFEREELYEVHTLPFENEVLRVRRTGATLPNFLNSIYFLDSLTGIATTYISEIYRTTNGGVSWELVVPSGAFGVTFRDICFVNPDTGYVNAIWNVQTTQGSILRGALFRTLDRGATWDTVWQADGVVYITMTCSQEGTPVVFRDINANTATVISEDGGITWSEKDYPQTYIYKLFSGRGYVIGTGMWEARLSADQGHTWSGLDIWGDLSLRYISVADSIAYCLLDDNVMMTVNLHTYALGKPYTPIYHQAEAHAVSDTECLIAGRGNLGIVENDFSEYGILAYSRDEGQHWQEWMFSDLTNWIFWHNYTPRAGYCVVGQQLIHVRIK
ncbi:MAG: hypothetical protein SF053_19760 [Bacteroidia bacterium]|nr:hypothetical protein [Bacteroidia bacterium]